MNPTITYGYAMNVGFGLSIRDGFYLKGGDVLSLYAKLCGARNLAAAIGRQAAASRPEPARLDAVATA